MSQPADTARDEAMRAFKQKVDEMREAGEAAIQAGVTDAEILALVMQGMSPQPEH